MTTIDELLEKLRMLKYDYDSMSTSLEDAIDDIAYELEQAIATLGNMDCKPNREGNCPACGAFVVRTWEYTRTLGGDWEFNPTMYHNYCPGCGRRVMGHCECENYAPEHIHFACSKCSYANFGGYANYSSRDDDKFNYCPSCGRKVVEL